MMLKRHPSIKVKWEELPPEMKNNDVRQYYELLRRKRGMLFAKRALDISVSLVGIILLSPLMAAVAVAVRLDSPGGALFKQERVTAGGRRFGMLKFRTMCADAERIGPAVTLGDDARITRIGRWLRRHRIDELPQLFNVLRGEMTLVGARPELARFVAGYTPEMYATLLLPAGMTSRASLHFKDSAGMFDGSPDPERDYAEVLIPQKMQYNLAALRDPSFWNDVATLLSTLPVLLGISTRKKSNDI